jgi:hypothetical protein
MNFLSTYDVLADQQMILLTTGEKRWKKESEERELIGRDWARRRMPNSSTTDERIATQRCPIRGAPLVAKKGTDAPCIGKKTQVPSTLKTGPFLHQSIGSDKAHHLPVAKREWGIRPAITLKN